MQVTGTSRYLSRAEVAQELGLGVYSVDRAIKSGDLPALRIGGRILIARERFEDFLNRSQLPIAGNELATHSTGEKK